MTHGRESAGPTARSSVLVVEDDTAVARSYARVFCRMGFDVSSCSCLAGARAALRAASGFTIALVDIGLPDGSGMELVEEILAEYPEIVPVVASGRLDAAASLECWRRGVLAVNKPFVGEQLEALVQQVVGRHDHWTERVEAFARANALSRQEHGVVRCAVHGLDLEATATTLGCAPLTADTYWRRVFAKTGLRSKLAVVAAVARRPVATSSASGTRLLATHDGEQIEANASGRT